MDEKNRLNMWGGLGLSVALGYIIIGFALWMGALPIWICILSGYVVGLVVFISIILKSLLQAREDKQRPPEQ